MAFVLVKKNKRLWIEGDGLPVYSPPDFVKLQSREPMQLLAQQFNRVGSRDINAIAAFETRYGPKRNSVADDRG